jgi:alpha-L-fucosidase
LPRKATLLNTGRPVECTVELAPSDHASRQGYLRLCNMPTNEMANTVLVVKLDFDAIPSPEGQKTRPDNDILSR